MGKRLTGQWRAEGRGGSVGSGDGRSATIREMLRIHRIGGIRRFPPGGTAHCYATI